MRAGELRHYVSILVATLTPDTHGGKAKTWLDLVTGTATLSRIAASVQSIRGGERLQATVVTAVSTYEVRLRYRVDVTPKMRVLWTPYKAPTAKTLEITDVNDGDGRTFIVLSCSEIQA